MKLHKSGLIGLVLSAALLGACEDKTEVVIPPPPDPPITLNLVPDECNLFVGATCQLVAVVSGGNASTVRTATFTSSNTQVATVNQTTGVVTAVNPGQAQITARATADANAADVSNVNVTIDPATVPPEISIKSVTVGNTNTPVQINNVRGQIDITANLEVPEGGEIAAVEWLVDNTVVCRQEFSGGAADLAAAADEAQAAVELVCSVNTAAFNATTGAVTFPNGPHQINVRVIGTQGTVVAEAPPTQFSQLVFNNPNFIAATVASSRGTALGSNSPRSLAPAGSLWHSGDIVFTLLSINYGAATNNVASVTATLTTSGLGVTGVAGCATTNNGLTDPTISVTDGGAGGVTFPSCAPQIAVRGVNAVVGGTFTLTFPENTSMANNGVGSVEDIFNPAAGGLTLTSVTTGGQAGPVCINPDPALNPIALCGTGLPGGSAPFAVFFANPLRVDNYAPRLQVFDHFRNPNNYFGPNSYLVSHVVPPAAGGIPACPGVPGSTPWFGLRRPCLRSVDYGVGSQTTAGNVTFEAVEVATGTAFAANTAADLAGRETATSLVWRIRTTIKDSGGNQRVLYATTTNNVFSSSAGGGTQFWGWDQTAPTQSVVAGAPADMSVNTMIPSWVVSYLDSATPPAGPSGFDANPVWVRLQRDAASLAASTCHDPDAAFAAVSCTSAAGGFVADDGLFDNPGFAGGFDGYFSWRHFVVDAAANISPEQARFTLNDYTAPSFTGGIVVPAVIAGGQGVAFSSALTDNVDLGSLDGYTGYAGTYVQFAPKSVLGTFGPSDLTGTSAGPLSTTAFVRRVEPNAGGGRPSGAPVPATDINYLVRDQAGHQIRYVVGPWGVAPYVAPNDGLCPAAPIADGTATQNCSARVASIAVQVLAAVGGVFPAGSAFPTEFGFADPLHGLFTVLAPSAATICNNTPRVNCASSTPYTTTLTATITGPAATYQSPFVAVDLYYLNAEGLWEHIATAPASGVTDNTVLNTRTFSYTGTWDARTWKVRPAGAAGTVHTVVAIGRNAAGDAWISTPQTVTVRGD
jgi:hypothetical protein